MYWLIELRRDPDTERIGEDGFALHVQVRQEQGGIQAEYWLWRGILFGPPTTELRAQPSHALAPERAVALLEELREAKLTPLPPSEVWLHPVNYLLEVHSGFSSARFAWQEDLPERWRELGPAVRRLIQLAEDHPSEV